MIAIHGQVIVQGHRVPTLAQAIHKDKISILVEAGSNGLYTEDGSHSYRHSYVSLFCDAPNVAFCPIMSKDGRVVGIELLGFSEATWQSLNEALDFAAAALRDTRDGVKD